MPITFEQPGPYNPSVYERLGQAEGLANAAQYAALNRGNDPTGGYGGGGGHGAGGYQILPPDVVQQEGEFSQRARYMDAQQERALSAVQDLVSSGQATPKDAQEMAASINMGLGPWGLRQQREQARQHEFQLEHQRQGFDLQAQLNQTRLNQEERNHLQSLERQMAYVDRMERAGSFTPEIANGLRTQLQTGRDPLAARLQAEQILTQQAHTQRENAQTGAIVSRQQAAAQMVARSGKDRNYTDDQGREWHVGIDGQETLLTTERDQHLEVQTYGAPRRSIVESVMDGFDGGLTVDHPIAQRAIAAELGRRAEKTHFDKMRSEAATHIATNITNIMRAPGFTFPNRTDGTPHTAETYMIQTSAAMMAQWERTMGITPSSTATPPPSIVPPAPLPEPDPETLAQPSPGMTVERMRGLLERLSKYQEFHRGQVNGNPAVVRIGEFRQMLANAINARTPITNEQLGDYIQFMNSMPAADRALISPLPHAEHAALTATPERVQSLQAFAQRRLNNRNLVFYGPEEGRTLPAMLAILNGAANEGRALTPSEVIRYRRLQQDVSHTPWGRQLNLVRRENNNAGN